MLSTQDLIITLATDLASKHVPIPALIKLIDSAEKPDEVVSEFDEVGDGLVHLLLSRVNEDEDEIITFVKNILLLLISIDRLKPAKQLYM